MLQVALGVPRSLNWLASRNPSTEAGVRVVGEPRPELVKPSTGLNAVDGAVNGKQSVLEGEGTFALFGDAWGTKVSVRARKFASSGSDLQNVGAMFPGRHGQEAKLRRSPSVRTSSGGRAGALGGSMEGFGTRRHV